MPHAEAAANSFSGFGLVVAARCAVGLNDWKTAEQHCRMLSERYENQRTTWYLACVRLNQGQLTKARGLADQDWNGLRPPYRNNQEFSIFLRDIIDGNPKQAKDAFLDPSILKDQIVYSLANAALVADSLGENAEKDAQFVEIGQRFEPSYSLPKFVSLFQLALRDSDRFAWNYFSFEEISANASHDDVTFAYYLAGKFLVLHKQHERGHEYLQCAAASFEISKSSCLLATLLLRELNVPVEETRLHVHSKALQPCVQLLAQCYREQRENRLDVARKRMDEALTLPPDFILGYLVRGRMSEADEDYAADIADYERALQVNPDCETAHYDLALLRAACPVDTYRDSPAARQHAQQVIDGRVAKTWFGYSHLATAEAEPGRFVEPVELQQQAMKLSPQHPDLPIQLKLYQEKKPYRIPLNVQTQTTTTQYAITIFESVSL
ncbi:MAG: hypothetical protein FJ267_13710, partial [Planctomycetes bacterium]|nr:hypothetical protein [Planctomycetota bacterium]